jgi:hypothetical protein
MKILLLILALAVSCLAQQKVDNSGAEWVAPMPLRPFSTFAGGCHNGHMATASDGVPGANVYVCGLSHDWNLIAPGVAAVTPAMLGPNVLAVLTDAATVTWAIAGVLNARASLTFTAHSGSRTLNLTGLVAGGDYKLELTQDATGGEGLILGTGCVWKVASAGAGAVTLTNAASAIDLLSFTYDGANCLTTFSAHLN